MSVFKNISSGILYVQGFLREGDGTLGAGAIKYINPSETFTGSNYYKRFTYQGLIDSGVEESRAADEAILELITDDGLPFSENFTNIPNYPKVYHELIGAGDSVKLDFFKDLNGPALFMTIESDQDVYVYLNGSDSARIDLDSSTSLTFSNGELLLNNIIISNTISGSSSAASVQVIVAGLL